MTDKTDKPPMKVVSIGTTPPEEDKLEVNGEVVEILEVALELAKTGELVSVAIAGVTTDGLLVDYTVTKDVYAQLAALTRLSGLFDKLFTEIGQEE
jgi:hypothetical protein